MTERNQENLAEETRVLGPVRMRQVDEARAEIVRIIRDLEAAEEITICLLYTSPSPRDLSTSRMPSSA